MRGPHNRVGVRHEDHENELWAKSRSQRKEIPRSKMANANSIRFRSVFGGVSYILITRQSDMKTGANLPVFNGSVRRLPLIELFREHFVVNSYY